MKCPKCKFENREGVKFCERCGTNIELMCPSCGAKIPPDRRFCGECGRQLDWSLDNEQGKPAINGERKHVTVLFSDVSGYTAMSEKLDPEEVKEIMSGIFGEITHIIKKYDGFIERFIGDAVMAVFGIPKAHEDDPVRAIKAAVEIHALAEVKNPHFEAKTGRPLALHTGINTGLAVTGEVNIEKGTHGLTGDAINLGSRLVDLARPGEILIGSETYHQTEGNFNFEPARSFRVKGKAEPVQAYKVISAKEKPLTVHRLSGLRANLVGRKSEMAQLEEAASRLREEGQGSVFSISGDAGTGKSRLVEEFKNSLVFEKFQWIESHAYSYAQNIPYFPLIDLISRAFHIEEGDTPEEVRERIRLYTETLKVDSESILLYVGSLYGLESTRLDSVSPDVWRSRLYDSLLEILNALARRALTVFCLEDLHWADPSSIELIRRFVLDLKHPAILLCIHRPVFNPLTARQLEKMGKIYHEIKIRDFSPQEAQDMLHSLLKTEEIPPDLKRFVYDKTEGNPFYLEELVNSLIESDTLIRNNGGWKITKSVDESVISGTIHGVISGRIDRLEKNTKMILREASVIGRTFLYEILKRITLIKLDIDKCLTSLERLDLIRAKSLQQELEYIFKHALTQEAVYSGILRTERKDIHERIALVIEQLFQDRISEFYETLSFHFKQGRSTHKAIQYLLKSAEKALRRYSFNESNLYFKEAFELTTAKPLTTEEEKEFLVDLLLKWSECYHLRGAYRGLIDVLTPYESLARSIKDKSRLAMFYGWLGFALGSRDRLKEGYQFLRQALSLSESVKDEKVIGYVCGWLALIVAELGHIDEALNYGERAKKTAEQFTSDWTLFEFAMNGHGTPGFFKGHVTKQIENSKWIAAVQKQMNARIMAAIEMSDGCAQFLAGDFSSAIKTLQSSIRLSVDPIWSLRAKFILGLAHTKIGQFKEAENILDEVIKASKEIGTEIWGTSAEGLQGTILIAKGHLSKGIKIYKGAVDTLFQNGSLYRYATGNYVLGSVYLQIVDPSGPKNLSFLVKNIGFLLISMPRAAKKAEYHFNKAVEVAKDIGAHGISGEAYLGLSLLHRAKRRNSDAKKCISEAIHFFEKCQAGIHLQQAKEVLASLE